MFLQLFEFVVDAIASMPQLQEGRELSLEKSLVRNSLH